MILYTHICGFDFHWSGWNEFQPLQCEACHAGRFSWDVTQTFILHGTVLIQCLIECNFLITPVLFYVFSILKSKIPTFIASHGKLRWKPMFALDEHLNSWISEFFHHVHNVFQHSTISSTFCLSQIVDSWIYTNPSMFMFFSHVFHHFHLFSITFPMVFTIFPFFPSLFPWFSQFPLFSITFSHGFHHFPIFVHHFFHGFHHFPIFSHHFSHGFHHFPNFSITFSMVFTIVPFFASLFPMCSIIFPFLPSLFPWFSPFSPFFLHFSNGFHNFSIFFHHFSPCVPSFSPFFHHFSHGFHHFPFPSLFPWFSPCTPFSSLFPMCSTIFPFLPSLFPWFSPFFHCKPGLFPAFATEARQERAHHLVPPHLGGHQDGGGATVVALVGVHLVAAAGVITWIIIINK